MSEVDWELPAWVQIVGGLWCLLAVVFFIRQIMVAYLAILTGG
jgi:hypothetical protein